jgi:hypothetical protein
VLQQVAEAAGTFPSSNESPADSPAPSLFKDHHSIVTNQNEPVLLFAFLQDNDSDPAIKVNIRTLSL